MGGGGAGGRGRARSCNLRLVRQKRGSQQVDAVAFGQVRSGEDGGPWLSCSFASGNGESRDGRDSGVEALEDGELVGH
jgi:hypothetical protein